MKIITTGNGPLDLDALACAVAYSEFLQLQGEQALADVGEKLTASISKAIISWGLPEKVNAQDITDAEFVLVDFSGKENYLPGVTLEKIVQIYDHHFFGNEGYWFDRFGKKAVIEAVGACATLIWREFSEAQLLDKISLRAARLLYAAIISNTLDLKASLTTDLDRNAVADLEKRVQLGSDWIATYYAEVEATVLKSPIEILANDTRIYHIQEGNWTIGQLELWDGTFFVAQNEPELLAFIKKVNPETAYGFITVPSIKDGFNLIIPKNEATVGKLREVLKLEKQGEIYRTDKLYLRKELYRLWD